MSDTPPMLDLAPPARQLGRLLDGVEVHHLDDPAPAWDTVAGLLQHLVGLTWAFRLGAEKAPDPAPDGPAAEPEPLVADWRERLPRQLDELVAAWRAPQAWEGTASVGGATLPAQVMGQVVLDELVIHGWDLARATRQGFHGDPASIAAVLAFTEASAAPGHEHERDGLFGPVVEVAPDAPALHRALGYAGRDPAWTPPVDG
jgi:uncharacterized protein (TIGR03086 family)